MICEGCSKGRDGNSSVDVQDGFVGAGDFGSFYAEALVVSD